MKLVFLLSFLLIGFVPFAFADIEKGLNYNDELIEITPSGSEIRKFTTVPERFLLNEQYVDFRFINGADFLSVETGHGSVKLNKSNCSFDFYKKGIIDGVPLFSDSIVAKMANNGTETWNEVTQITNALCEIYGNENQLVAKKFVSGVGLMEYKYINTGSAWKTQLEATNLSAQTNKKFGFTQTIDLNRDTVHYGGTQKNLDNYADTTFNRTWLEDNQGRIINFLNDISFDFDLGFDNLKSIAVYDTGLNKSKLSFNYLYNSEILLPNNILIIDPTFTSQDTSYLVEADAGASVNCNASAWVKSAATGRAEIQTSGDPGPPETCHRAIASFDVSSLPATIQVSDVDASFTSSGPINMGALSCSSFRVMNNPATAAAGILWNDSGDGSQYVNADTNCRTANTYSLDLGALADADFQANKNAGNTTFAFSVKLESEARDGAGHSVSFVNNAIDLTVIYTAMEPTEFGVTIDSFVVGDTAKINGTITLTQALPLPVTLDSIQLLKNNSQINLNNTNSTFSSIGQSINFGPFWNRLTTGAVYNFTVIATVDNSTGSQITNSSSTLATREYDSSYLPALDNPSIQGDVNATLTRFDGEDGILLKVNRLGVSTGDTWQIECIAQTNSEAAQTKDETQSWAGDWSNETNTGYFNTTYTGYANSHAYITCFNEDQLFTMTSFTNSSLALLGIQLFDDSYGAMLGVPVGVFFLVMTAGMANKRTAPTFIIVITGIAGTMATIGFFSFEPIVWGLALVTAMLGIFVNQKIF